MILDGDYKDAVFRTVNGRCAVPSSLLPSGADVATFAAQRGWKTIKVDLEEVARSVVGIAAYKLQASEEEAPRFFDCSGFVRWVYAQAGVDLPRLAVQQMAVTTKLGKDDPVQTGDLIFRTALRNFTLKGDEDMVGHVGMFLGDKRIVHASYRSRTVEVADYDRFIGKYHYRATCRVFTGPFTIFEVGRDKGPRWTATRISGLLRQPPSSGAASA